MERKRKPQYEVFAKNLKTAYEKWKMNANNEERNQQVLADRIGVSDRKTISDWCNAYSFPSPDFLDSLCDELNVTKRDLLKATKEDQYLYDENFTHSTHEKYKLFADSIGLNADFMKFVKSNINDELFPVWSPIKPKGDLLDSLTFQRVPISKAFKAEEQNEFQREMHSGKTVNLTWADYMFMKEVQEEVIKFIEYLYYKRSQEMIEECDQCSKNYESTDSNGVTFITNPYEVISKFDKYYDRVISASKKWEAEHGKDNQKE